MRNLIAIEVARLWSRRLLHWVTAAVIGGCLLAGTLTFLNSSTDPQAVAAAENRRKTEMQRCIDGVANGSWGQRDPLPEGAAEDPAAFCKSQVWVEDPRFRYEEMKWIAGTMAFPLMTLGLLLGASAIGAEWPHRGVTTLLTWEPRRTRVLTAKLIASAGSGFTWAFVLGALFSITLLPAGLWRGTMDGVDGSWLTGYALLLGRIGAMAGLGALIGTALATLGRNTAAAFGIGFAYLTAGEGLVRAFKPSWSDWLIGDNLALFLIGPNEVDHLGHSQSAAGLLLVAYGVALALIAVAVFRRRELV